MIITIIIMISFSLNRTSGNVQMCDPELSTKNHTISHYLFFFPHSSCLFGKTHKLQN